MIYEYAIDPSIAATWFQLKEGRFFKAGLGLGTPRIVSSFPRSWKRHVWNEFRQSEHDRDFSIKRMETMLEHLCRKTVNRRGHNWDNSKSWLENAESEHGLAPFDAIVAKDNPRNHERVICVDSIDSDTPLWFREHQCAVSRDAQIQEAISPLLRIATQIVFVDPYFSTERRFTQPMRRYLEIIASERNIARRRGCFEENLPHIEICRSTRADHCCASTLSSVVPHGLNLIVHTFDDFRRRKALHNRYILTDVGGLLISHGLDEKRGDHDDITVLSEKPYLKWWNQYSNGAPQFKKVGEMHVRGKARG